jgi:hypothetical protein
MARSTTRQRPLTWDETLDAADLAERELRALLEVRLPPLVHDEIEDILERLLLPVLIRSGRREEQSHRLPSPPGSLIAATKGRQR